MKEKKLTKTVFKDSETIFIAIDFSKSPNNCELCGKKSELRPYGPNQKWICFECGIKNEPVTELNFLSVSQGVYNK